MEDGRIPKDIIYGELAFRPAGKSVLRYSEVYKLDTGADNIDPADWEGVAEDCSDLRRTVKARVQRGEEMTEQQWEEMRERRRQRENSLKATFN